ncbi:hypothetical protein [Streptomyces sp. NPDC047043]
MTRRPMTPPRITVFEIAKAGPAARVVLEATYGWYWAADALAARRCT